MKTTFNFLIILTLMLLSNIIYSQSVPSYVPTNGLVGWWGFNGNAQDGSGNGNHGTVNGATLTTDRFSIASNAYEFNRSSIQSIDVSNTNSLNSITKTTISFWFNVASYGEPGASGHNHFINKSDQYNQQQFIVANNFTGLYFYYGPQSSYFQTSILPPLNLWNNLIVTYNYDGIALNSWCRFYLNGICLDSFPTTSALSITTFDLKFGGYGGANMNMVDGKLDDIGIWNRALTPQEITNLYNSQLPTQTSLCLPTITTTSPSSVGMDSVVIGGNITNDGGSSIVLRGVCYSTTPNPNMGNSRTNGGSGIGSFNSVLRGLNPSTTYYARSYAKNSNGVVVYGNEVSFTTSSITIGSNYAGGIVFYIDSTGQHGLVCAPSDQGNFQWGCYGTDIVGTSTSFGTGQANTNLILAGCSTRPIAASVCDDLVLNGYSDWYLPSVGELLLMYSNLYLQGIGGFLGDFYWSSSQSTDQSYSVSALVMYYGVYMNGDKRNDACRVRAVRAF